MSTSLRSICAAHRGWSQRRQAQPPVSYLYFLADALCPRAAKLPFETFPPPDFAAADWIREAAFEVMPPCRSFHLTFLLPS